MNHVLVDPSVESFGTQNGHDLPVHGLVHVQFWKVLHVVIAFHFLFTVIPHYFQGNASILVPQKKKNTTSPWNPGIHPTPPPCRRSKRSSWCPPRAPASAPRTPQRTRWQRSARQPRGPVPGGARRRRRRWGDRRQDPPVTSYLGRNHGLMSGKTCVFI